MFEIAMYFFINGLLIVLYTGHKLANDSRLRKQQRLYEATQRAYEATVCGAPAPDDSVHCADRLGHYGWHNNGGTSWFGDSWECDQWAETEAGPTVAAPTPEATPRKPLKFKIGMFGTRKLIKDDEQTLWADFVTNSSGETCRIYFGADEPINYGAHESSRTSH